jgi:hypothetical protein
MRLRPAWLVVLFLGLTGVVAATLLARRYSLAPLPAGPGAAALPHGLAVTGGTPMSVRIKVEPFLQNDPRWGGQKLGMTLEEIRAVGCTLCSLSMALTSQGFAIDPPSLNTRLAQNSGFTESGLIIWGSVKSITQKRFVVEVNNHPTHALIDAQLTKGNPVIAKVLYNNSIWHWILICGKAERTYLIHDPLKPQPFQDMTSYPTGIFAVRYLRPL